MSTLRLSVRAKELLDLHISKISIINLYLANAGMKRTELIDNEPGVELIVRGNHQILVETHWDLRAFRAVARLSVRGDKKTDGGEDQTGFEISADYRIEYQVNDFQGNEEDLTTLAMAFSTTQSVMHAWPFWREFILSSTAKLGLNPVYAPLFVRPAVLAEPDPSEIPTLERKPRPRPKKLANR